MKAYTVNDESKYLVVSGVPAIKIQEELERLCLRYGKLELLKILPDYPQEDYAEAYLVKYDSIKKARFAKVKLDGKSFFGGVLHVFYAPELETVDETREKLADRRKSIAALTRYDQDAGEVNKTKQLSKMEIRNVVVKRYLAHLKDDVACVYQKHFMTNNSGGSASTSDISSSEKDSGAPISVPSSISNTQTDNSCTTEVGTESSCTGTQNKTEKLLEDVKGTSSSQPRKRVKCASISQAPKKIKMFKDAKILSYNESGGHK